jgi:hypothetical protein
LSPAARELVHDVYFTLIDGSEAARAQLIAACYRYLTGHDGVLFMSAGGLVSELARPVNDRGFDVALHIRFADKAAHDLYQEAERHKAFMAEQRPNWKSVRVFDSWVEPGK